MPDPDDLAEFFGRNAGARQIFEAVRAAVESSGPVTLRAGKSQISFRRRVAFAWVWIPGQYLKGDRPPLVLTVGLRRRDLSPRWKQVVEPYPGRFVHHMELHRLEQVDQEVRQFLAEAWTVAG
jgi:hypothetical protein